MSEGESGVLAVHRALWSAFGRLPSHAASFVVVSLVCSLAAVPVVTLGPAALVAYATAHSIREEGRVDRRFVLATLREHGLDALLLGGVVLLTAGLSLLYFGRFVATGATVAGVLGAAGTYVTVHLVLIVVPTFVALVRGDPLFDAVRTGYRWTIDQPLQALSMLILTTLLLIASAVLTVAVVIVFPLLAACFHTELLAPVVEPPGEPAPPSEDRPAPGDYPGAGD